MPAWTLQLRPQDSNLAVSILAKQRAQLSDLGMNVFFVDKPGVSRTIAFDLLADFSTHRNFGISGRVWIELKVMAGINFSQSLDAAQESLRTKLATEANRDSTIGGAMLLVTKVSRTGGRWGSPTLVPSLLRTGSHDWVPLVSRRRPARGQSQLPKPSLSQIWQTMEWHHTEEGHKVGLLKHFLQSFSLPAANPSQRAATFNAMLRDSGQSGQVQQIKLKDKSGKKAWVADKDTFRSLYGFV